MTKKFVAQLVDKTNQVQLPVYFVDLESKEGLLGSIDTIKNSKYPEEAVTGMLAHLKFLSSEYLEDQDVQSVFAEVESSDKPVDIDINGESYPLLYGALDQYVELFGEAPEAPVSDPVASSENTAELTALQEQVGQLETQVAELTTATSEKDGQIESLQSELTEKVASLEAATTELTSKETELVETKQSLETAIGQLAQFVEDERTTLIKAVAEKAKALDKPYTKEKTDEELITFLSARSDETLGVMLEDYSLEIDSSVTEDVADPEPTTPKVDDPGVTVNVEAITAELANNITVEEDTEEDTPYRIILKDRYDEIKAARKAVKQGD